MLSYNSIDKKIKDSNFVAAKKRYERILESFNKKCKLDNIWIDNKYPCCSNLFPDEYWSSGVFLYLSKKYHDVANIDYHYYKFDKVSENIFNGPLVILQNKKSASDTSST